MKIAVKMGAAMAAVLVMQAGAYAANPNAPGQMKKIGSALVP